MYNQSCKTILLILGSIGLIAGTLIAQNEFGRGKIVKAKDEQRELLLPGKLPESNSQTKLELPRIVEAEAGTFTGAVDRHSCWHNVMLTDASHSTHSGRGAVDTKNEIGSYIEVDYDSTWSGLHRITVRYTHVKPDPRPGALLVNSQPVATLSMQQTEALPAWKTDSTVTELKFGRNVIRLTARNEGGLPNIDYIKVAQVRDVPRGDLPNIQIFEAEDGRFTGTEDHHSCWNFIAQKNGPHSDFTGEGFVDTLNKKGSFIEVEFESVTAGPHSLGIRYVHGKPDTRLAEVRVNGVLNTSKLAFAPTPTWTTWTTISKPIKLVAGRNVIRVTALGTEGLANVDHFVLTPGSSRGEYFMLVLGSMNRSQWTAQEAEQ